MMYGSYKAPRELLWLIGMLVYLALMAEAFFGYVLPWGNMSFWGAQVIVNLFGTIPVIGPGLVEWIRGDYGIADATLRRFFALHVAAVPLAHPAACDAASRGAAAHGLEQSGRHRDQGARRPRRPSARWHPVSSLLHGEGHRRHRRHAGDARDRRVLRAELRRAVPRRRRISSLPIRSRRPSTSRRCGTSRPTTPSCAPCRTSAWARF